jgi:predicted protein tyrosine phosphatase
MKDVKIIVRSKQAAENSVCDVPWAAISISSDEGRWAKLSEENRVGLLQLQFHDLDRCYSGYTIFGEEQARQIIDFAQSVWDKIDVLLVHCEAGVSRSPATAAALSVIFKGPGSDQEFFKNYRPNMLVYRTILNTFHGEPTKMDPEPMPEASQDEMQQWGDLLF